MRVGFGFDAHPLVSGRPLILGGVRVPFDRGLEGFSDADVVAHALIDAVLGAAALGDSGAHFPAGDPRFAGADSLALLRQAVGIARDAGYSVTNVDCTVVADVPALAPYVGRMRDAIAAAMGIAPGQCSVKAKRTEGLGFVGEGAGMAAYAVALVAEEKRS